MARKTFFSFKYYGDVSRAMVVRNSWVTKKEEAVGFIDSADFEKVKQQGDIAIKNWIGAQLKGTSVTVVLIGEKTSTSRWVIYEIRESIKMKNGLVAIFINNIPDFNKKVSKKGKNPFVEHFSFGPSTSVNLIYPCCTYYDWIQHNGHKNIGAWIEKAAKDAGR